MLLFGKKIINVKPKHAFILPLISTASWWGMLTAMLVCWIVQGRPLYGSDHVYFHSFITFLSNVGATNLQPVFISGSACMGVFFVWATWEEYYLRTPERHYLMPSINRHTRGLHISSIVFAAIASFSILMVSCFKNSRFGHVHNSFVGLFIVFDFLMAVCHIAAYVLYYRHYQHYCNRNWFLCSALIKFVWIILALGLVIGYLTMYRLAHKDGDTSKEWGYSGVCEWSLCFIFPVLLITLSFDLWTTKYKDNESFDDSFDDSDLENGGGVRGGNGNGDGDDNDVVGEKRNYHKENHNHHVSSDSNEFGQEEMTLSASVSNTINQRPQSLHEVIPIHPPKRAYAYH
ncbi:unnamed protein product [Ambrosiozyma monospora]|uniref:Unnamed protein product n=1 Tax=Ambrosiozyma monospora TaxID=43982 RepID=A0A9W6Z6F8_AMBMO|nr:unnamed protein product [Ambrosiozyma monospora]